MRLRGHNPFACVRSEGGLLPPELLARVAEGDTGLPGTGPASYHLAAGERVGEAVNRSWSGLLGAWAAFDGARHGLPEGDAGTTLTRERWLLPLFGELGFGRLLPARAVEAAGSAYPVSHGWHCSPLHLVSFRYDLDRREPGVAGAARFSPHALVQELLNRSPERLWGVVTNGLRLRLLRDNVSLTRQAFVEWDLEAMMSSEAYSDFVVLWLVCHQSRVEAEQPEECLLEQWSEAAAEQGTRALERLRGGVEDAIVALGRGYVAHPANDALRTDLRSGALSGSELYRQLLRQVYRLLFCFVAEDRDLLHPPGSDPAARERFDRWFSTRRLRGLAVTQRGTRHHDLHTTLALVWRGLASADGLTELALPALGGRLFAPSATAALEPCLLANDGLLDAVRALALAEAGGIRRPVDFKNLGAEELGSVYESLLELHPEIDADAGHFALATAAGHERKKTGSYYTPTPLIASLLDSALEPVLDEAARAPDPEAAILALRVCDPACGSGHFLIAAAHRIAKRLATVRTGDAEPAPDAQRTALRDTIGACIYGVDVNPMAVELCQTALWMEALQPGRPLGFLDHRIVVGNSLLGATPALVAQGVPDAAFKPLGRLDKGFEQQVRAALDSAQPGAEHAAERHAAFAALCREAVDDTATATELRRRNDRERKRQGAFVLGDPARVADDALEREAAAVGAIGEETVAEVEAKRERHERLLRSREHRRAKLLADVWCTAFAGSKQPGTPAVTQATLDAIARDPAALEEGEREVVEGTARRHGFLHWHVAFPDVFVPDADGGDAGWRGGFDIVLGNPPWERVKLQEKEWFAVREPAVAAAPNKAARERAIAALAETEPAILHSFLVDRRDAEAASAFMRTSGRYPLCGRGDVNTYAIFAETNRAVISPTGRVGCIVPSGIATDDTTKHFFAALMESRTLRSLYDFENAQGIFPAVHRSTKFCLLTLTGAEGAAEHGAEFVFFAHRTADLADPERRFTLTPEDIALLNPNTRTCPIFRSRRDAELTKGIYCRVPVLVREGDPEGNPWGFRPRRVFDLNKTSDLAVFVPWTEGNGDYVPHYGMGQFHQFDHRFATYEGDTRRPFSHDTAEPSRPRAIVRAREVTDRLAQWHAPWFVTWRDYCRNTDERTCIATVLPTSATDFGVRLALIDRANASPLLLASFNSFTFDYCVRLALGGTHLSDYIMRQLPVFPPDVGSTRLPFLPQHLDEWLRPRVLELTYTAHDLAPFARDFGYLGEPFRWDDDRRFLLRAELDAAFFHLYGIERDDVDYILDTFPIVRRKDEQRFGEYHTKRVILEVYDAMAHAAESGAEYRTRLDPPPADPSLAHGTAAPGAQVIPFPFERVAAPAPEERFVTHAPVYSLRAAAGAFGNARAVEPDGWVRLGGGRRLGPDMFVARVEGRSMEPTIPDGAWCLFNRAGAGSRDGQVVLAQHHEIADPDTGGSYTVKRYRSRAVPGELDLWQHAEIRLESDNAAYPPIVLQEADSDEVRIVATFVDVVHPGGARG